MKHVLWLGGLVGWLLGGAALVTAQTSAAPRLTLSQDSWNFGEIWHPQAASLTLIVKNEGTTQLEIGDVRTTCGCTLAETGRKSVPPGETTEVKVRYNSEGKQGHVESKVIIESNDPQRPTVEMNISGVVNRAVTRTPLGGLVIRTLDTKPGQTGTVKLENQMSEPMKLRLSGSSLQEWLDVEIKEVTPGQVYEVVGTTKKDLPTAGVRGQLVFDTGLSKEEQLTVFARVQVMSRVEAVPPVIFLDPKRDNKPSDRFVSVQYYGTGNFSVTQGDSKTPGIKVTLKGTESPSSGLEKLTPRMTALVRSTVSLPPASAIPPEGALIEYTTSDPQFPKVQVLVTTSQKVWHDTIQGPPEAPVRPL